LSQALQAEIEKKAEEETSRILETAGQEAQKIIGEASAAAERRRGERAKALERELDAQEKAALAVARMDMRGKLLRVESEWAKRIYEETERRLGQVAESGGREYQELLGRFILEGIRAMKGSKFIVEANARDKEIVSKLLADVADKAGKNRDERVVIRTGGSPLRTSGGVIVSAEDGVQSFNNTLEARLSSASGKLEGKIRTLLFGGREANE
jgi:vacuolar-type H+-ATPase subunit E/Vma4